MSVKLMTTEQIHNDLTGIARMWAGGVPTEQMDRVNALKSELKRRGVDQRIPGQEEIVTKSVVIEGMDEEQLTKELQSLSVRLGATPGDEALQERFANVRFQLRKLTKNGNGLVAQSEPQPAPSLSSFDEGMVRRTTAEIPRRSAASEQMLREEFLAAQAAHIGRAEEQHRKVELAKCAAKISTYALAKHPDPDGDDIEAACALGVAVAENIFAKVGL